MAFDKTKLDPALGEEIHKHLVFLGKETPTNENLFKTNTDKIERIQEKMADIMSILGLDLCDDSLVDTPKRIAKMFVLEDFWGLLPGNFPKMTTIENKMGVDEMVKVKRIKITSRCEHHIEKILGYGYIAYIPDKKVLGLSKISRVVEYFSKRPQVQERLTEQIFYALTYILGTENVAVYINAEHLCMTTRGAEDAEARTSTSKLGGVFKTDHSVRSEFFQFLGE